MDIYDTMPREVGNARLMAVIGCTVEQLPERTKGRTLGEYLAWAEAIEATERAEAA